MRLVRSPLKSQELFGDGPRQVGAARSATELCNRIGIGPQLLSWGFESWKGCRQYIQNKQRVFDRLRLMLFH
jgi:hypothetical protein